MKQLSRKIVAIGLCVLMITMHLFALGGSGYRDEKLVKAEEITKALIVANDENYDGECSGYYIKGLDEQEDYILVTSNKGGYAIFTTEFQLIEYSPYNTSPFGETAKADSYYAGPANYFAKVENEEIKNVHTDKKIAQEEKLEIATAVKGKLKEIHEQDKLKTEENKKVEIEQKQKEEENRVKTIDEHEELNQQQALEQSSIGGDYGLNVEIPNTNDTFTGGVISSTTLIQDYNFFLQSPYIAINDNGNSAAIAVQLFLSFNNWSADNRLITEPKFLARYDEQGNLKEYVLNEPYSKEYISTTYISNYGNGQVLDSNNDYISRYTSFTEEQYNNFDQILDNAKSFYEYLYYMFEYYKAEVGPSDLCVAMTNYITQYTSLDEEDYNIGLNIVEKPAREITIEQIEANRPVINTALTAYQIEGITQTYQWVVTYGIQRLLIEDVFVDGLIAHFGYDGMEYVWFNKEFMQNVITMQLNHNHVYQPVEDNSHIIECSVENGGCGSRKTTEEHTLNYWSNCDLIYNFKTEEETDYHFAYCSCGFAQKTGHLYTYDSPNQEFHTIKCSACNLTPKQERHTFKYGNCYFCGMTEPE